MSLEALLEEIETRVDNRMSAHNKRSLASATQELTDYTLSRTDAYRVDDARAHLGYRAISQHDRNRDSQQYRTLAQDLEAQTAQHNPFDDSSRTAITILKGSNAHYTTRFAHITNHLEHGLHYTDALLCREHLRQDSYVRRRARDNQEFAAQRTHMLDELDEYISACRKEMRSHHRKETAKRWGFRAAAACWGATLAYAATPLEWLI